MKKTFLCKNIKIMLSASVFDLDDIDCLVYVDKISCIICNKNSSFPLKIQIKKHFYHNRIKKKMNRRKKDIS